MSKYEPLQKFLLHAQQDCYEMTFEEIEGILANPLPPSARRHQAWWANESHGSHSHARSWQEAGWETSKVNLSEETVRFERRASSGTEPAPPLPPAQSDADLFERAMAVTGISDRKELVEKAVTELMQREAARRLAAMGGTMPDIKAPPRRRSTW